MAQRLSELCRDILCQTDCSLSNLDELLLFPLPSTVEKILLSSPKKLPFEMADQLVEDLAKRGKLSSRILHILMESTLTRLNLTCLRSIGDEPTFLSQLANQEHVVDVDLSFSPCFGELSIPFLRSLSQTCHNTLMYFSASSVRGDVGFEYLRHFSRLRHLDVSFTSTSFDVIRELSESLNELTHLDVSGTDLSWPAVFDFASNVTHLKHLGMNNLVFLTDDEQRTLFQPVFRLDWVKSFFEGVPTLTSLDVSSVKVERADFWGRNNLGVISNALTHTMDAVLSSAPKYLSHLTTSWWFSDRVSAELDAGNYPFEQVIFIMDDKVPRGLYSNCQESISRRGVILNDDATILTEAQLEMMLSKGLSLLNRNDYICAMTTISRSLIPPLSSTRLLRKLFEVAIFVFQCRITTRSGVNKYVVQRILYIVSKAEGQEIWNEVQPLWEILLESLLDPSFYGLNADGCGRIFGLKDVICLVVERLKVVSNMSLAQSAAVFILNVFDRCRPRFSLSSYELDSSERNFVINVEKNVRDVLEAFFDSLSDDQREGFVMINNFPKKLSKKLLWFVSHAIEVRNWSPHWEFFGNEISYRFDVLRLISSRLSSVQQNLVDRGVGTSYVEKWLFHDMQKRCSLLEAYGSLLAFLISLAENSSLRLSLISPSLLRCLCESDRGFFKCVLLQKSYLACLLLSSESTWSQKHHLFPEDFALHAVHIPTNMYKSDVLSFSVGSLKEMSRFKRERVVAQFGKKCLAVLQH